MDENWAACELQYRDGQTKRFAADERADADLPKDIEYGTQMPGGDGQGSFVLPRPPKLRADDAALFSKTLIYGPGGRRYHQGNVIGIPQVGPNEIRIEVEGPVAELDNDAFFRQLYLSRDIGRFAEPSRQRQIDRLDAGDDAIGGPTTTPDKSTGVPSLTLVANRGFGSGSRERVEAWFDGGYPEAIGDVYYAWEIKGATNTVWDFAVILTEDDVATTSLTASGDRFGSATGAEFLSDLGAVTPGRWLLIRAAQDADTSGTADRKFFIAPLVVIGNHGLSLAEDADGLPTVLGSDAVAHLLSGTSLSFSTGPSGSIEPSIFGIPDLDFSEGAMRREAVERITALGGAQDFPNDWGVYDGEFFWRSPGTYGRTWRIRRDEFADSLDEGPAAEGRCGRLVMRFEDAAGTKLSVGPPGSDADFEDAVLEDADPNNPARDLTRVEDMGIANLEVATAYGRVLLADANRLSRRGTVTIRGEARDEAGNVHPAALVRAGDRVVIEDDDEPVELPINSTSPYSHNDLTVTANVGAIPHRLDVALARKEAVTPQ